MASRGSPFAGLWCRLTAACVLSLVGAVNKCLAERCAGSAASCWTRHTQEQRLRCTAPWLVVQLPDGRPSFLFWSFPIYLFSSACPVSRSRPLCSAPPPPLLPFLLHNVQRLTGGPSSRWFFFSVHFFSSILPFLLLSPIHRSQLDRCTRPHARSQRACSRPVASQMHRSARWRRLASTGAEAGIGSMSCLAHADHPGESGFLSPFPLPATRPLPVHTPPPFVLCSAGHPTSLVLHLAAST